MYSHRNVVKEGSNYIAEINGLRAVSVMAVVLFHAFPSFMTGGFIGVDIFFVISGFLISKQVFEHVVADQFSLFNFFGRRIRRIFPALIVVGAAVMGFGWLVMLPEEYAQLGKHMASSAFFFNNFVLSSEVGYFNPDAETKPLLHLWSLAVEEQFYVFWPLIILIVWLFKLSFPIVILVLGSLSILWHSQLAESQIEQAFFLPMGRIWELLAGSLLAWYKVFAKQTATKPLTKLNKHLFLFQKFQKLVAVLHNQNLFALIGLTLVGTSLLVTDSNLFWPSLMTLFPIFGTLLILVSGPNASINRVLLANPLAVWFGLISYPLYLWHWPVFSFARIIEGAEPSVVIRIIAIILSVLLAWLTFKFVERPIRHSRQEMQCTVLLAIMLLLLGTYGFGVYLRDGVTSNNFEYQRISRAHGDWDYPGSLRVEIINGLTFAKTSQKEPKIFIIGDSHVEQYGPRIEKLYRDDKIQEVAFLTGGGCPPVPNVLRRDRGASRCANLIRTFNELSAQYNPHTVIIGGAFNRYFWYDKRENGLIYTENAITYPLTTRQNIDKAKAAFVTFIERLTARYNVVVLLDNPVDELFSPKSMMLSSNERRQIPLALKFQNHEFTQAKYQVDIELEMIELLQSTRAHILSQADIICPRRVCRTALKSGEPIYMNAGHFRPFFAIETMDLLDQYLLN
jgi:peptidoglycan/LPS O-acetylase OafA/YrhL